MPTAPAVGFIVAMWFLQATAFIIAMKYPPFGPPVFDLGGYTGPWQPLLTWSVWIDALSFFIGILLACSENTVDKVNGWIKIVLEIIAFLNALAMGGYVPQYPMIHMPNLQMPQPQMRTFGY
jgi:hypothetical protein